MLEEAYVPHHADTHIVCMLSGYAVCTPYSNQDMSAHDVHRRGCRQCVSELATDRYSSHVQRLKS